jgi:D-alanine-D-alanine ligase
VINEVNTMPGFTPSSMFPSMWQASGVEYAELVDRLIQAALRRPNQLLR